MGKDLKSGSGSDTSVRRTGDVDAFLARLAATPAPAQGARGRLVFAMDATASRQPRWDEALHLQAEMFEATRTLGGLEVQLVFYRGFGECKSSRWMADAAALRDVMLKVQCLGGRTQIARVLRHTLAEARRGRIGALVFVGDCVEEDADLLCDLAGQLGLASVPAFVFHEGGEPVAARTLRQIARLSGGAYCPFDAASAAMLRELLGAVAAYASGGRKALEQRGGQAVAGLLAQLK